MLNVSSCASAMELLPLIELLVLKGPGPPLTLPSWPETWTAGLVQEQARGLLVWG